MTVITQRALEDETTSTAAAIKILALHGSQTPGQ